MEPVSFFAELSYALLAVSPIMALCGGLIVWERRSQARWCAQLRELDSVLSILATRTGLAFEPVAPGSRRLFLGEQLVPPCARGFSGETNIWIGIVDTASYDRSPRYVTRIELQSSVPLISWQTGAWGSDLRGAPANGETALQQLRALGWIVSGEADRLRIDTPKPGMWQRPSVETDPARLQRALELGLELLHAHTADACDLPRVIETFADQAERRAWGDKAIVVIMAVFMLLFMISAILESLLS